MTSPNETYMEFIAHPDEPEFKGEKDLRTNFRLNVTNRHQLKKHVWSFVFHKRHVTA